MIRRVDARIITGPVMEDAGLQHPDLTADPDVIDTPLPRPEIARKHSLQIVKLIDQHLLKTRHIGTIGVENLCDKGAPVFPDVLSVPGLAITEVEA